MPADAARRPPGPAQAAPKARAVVHTAHVPFRWQTTKRAKGYDLRVARDRGFTSQMLTLHVRGAKARVLLRPGRWFWKVRAAGKVNSRWSNIRQVVVRPKGDAYPPTRPTALRVTAVAEDSVTVMFGASKDNRGVTTYELLTGSGKVLARGTGAPLTAVRRHLRHDLRAARPRPGRRRPRLAGLAGRPGAHACLHRSAAARRTGQHARHHDRRYERGAGVGPARDPDGTVRRYAVYRNGVLLGQPATTGFLARNLAPSTPYRFTVAAIDGGGHRSADSALDTATQAPIPATGPAYAYLLASTDRASRTWWRTTGRSTVRPTYFEVRADGPIVGQDDPLHHRLRPAARHPGRAALREPESGRSSTPC